MNTMSLPRPAAPPHSNDACACFVAAPVSHTCTLRSAEPAGTNQGPRA